MACSDFDVMMTAGAFLIHKDFLLLELQVLLFGIILAECKFLYTSFGRVKMFYFPLQNLASACLFAGFSLIVTELKNLYTSFFGSQRAREDICICDNKNSASNKSKLSHKNNIYSGKIEHLLFLHRLYMDLIGIFRRLIVFELNAN